MAMQNYRRVQSYLRLPCSHWLRRFKLQFLLRKTYACRVCKRQWIYKDTRMRSFLFFIML